MKWAELLQASSFIDASFSWVASILINPPHAVDRTYDRTKSLFNNNNPLAYDLH